MSLNLPEVFVPARTGRQTQPVLETLHEGNLLPDFLTVPEPPAPVDPLSLLNYEEVRRLDAPFYVDEAGYKLNEELAERFQKLSKYGHPRCRNCNGSGINEWRNAGRTAKVCKCVRKGRSLELLAIEVVG